MSERATIKAAWITFAGMIIAASIAVSQALFNSSDDASQAQSNSVTVNLVEQSDFRVDRNETTSPTISTDEIVAEYADISKEVAFYGPLQIEDLTLSEALPIDLILGNGGLVVSFRLDGLFDSELVGLTVTTQLVVENEQCRIYGTREQVSGFPQVMESWHVLEGGCGKTSVSGLTMTFEAPSIDQKLVHELMFEDYRL